MRRDKRGSGNAGGGSSGSSVRGVSALAALAIATVCLAWSSTALANGNGSLGQSYIETVRGVGYRFAAPPEEPSA